MFISYRHMTLIYMYVILQLEKLIDRVNRSLSETLLAVIC
jgi:hypothetical protein